jgi:hypothetical protein
MWSSTKSKSSRQTWVVAPPPRSSHRPFWDKSDPRRNRLTNDNVKAMAACYYSLIRRTQGGRLAASLPGVAAFGIEDEIVRELPGGVPKLCSRWLSTHCLCPRRAWPTASASRPGSISTSGRGNSPNRRVRELRCTATSERMYDTFDSASLPSAVRRSLLAYRSRVPITTSGQEASSAKQD